MYSADSSAIFVCGFKRLSIKRCWNKFRLTVGSLAARWVGWETIDLLQGLKESKEEGMKALEVIIRLQNLWTQQYLWAIQFQGNSYQF